MPVSRPSVFETVPIGLFLTRETTDESRILRYCVSVRAV